MSRVEVSAERRVEASAETVYGYLADMVEHHPKFLPDAFSGFEVESGGYGAAFTPVELVTDGWVC